MGKNIYTKEFDNGFKKTNINNKKKKGTTKPTKQQVEEMKWRKKRDIICNYIDESLLNTKPININDVEKLNEEVKLYEKRKELIHFLKEHYVIDDEGFLHRYTVPKIKINFYTKENLNFCCYRFINCNGEIIYVGRAKNLITRLGTHDHLPEECYKQIERIEYCKFNSNDDLDLAEPYFIAKWKPKFNQDFVNKKYSFTLKEFEEKEWKILKNKSIKSR